MECRRGGGDCGSLGRWWWWLVEVVDVGDGGGGSGGGGGGHPIPRHRAGRPAPPGVLLR